MTLRCLVVGAGTIGRLRAATIREHPETELVGVADVVQANAAQAAAGTTAETATDYRRLLEHRPDVVFVASPLPDHEAMVLDAFAAGAHVLCEKPLANTVAAAGRMVAAARAAGRTLAVGFNHRYYPAIKFVKQALDQGLIGELDHLRVFGGHDGLSNFRADWQFRSPASGGGAMMDVGIHMTDLAGFLLGDITEVYGVASNRIWQLGASEDNAMALFKSARGIPALYQATWTEWKGYRFFVEAYGDRGMVRGYYAPMQNLLVTQDRPGGPRRRIRKFYPEIMLREKFRGWQTTARLSFQEELADFLRMLRGEPSALADGFAGFRAVEIAHAVHRSTASGEPVRLSPRAT